MSKRKDCPNCAADAIAPSTPQSEGVYVANSDTGKFHYTGCRMARS